MNVYEITMKARFKEGHIKFKDGSDNITTYNDELMDNINQGVQLLERMYMEALKTISGQSDTEHIEVIEFTIKSVY